MGKAISTGKQGMCFLCPTHRSSCGGVEGAAKEGAGQTSPADPLVANRAAQLRPSYARGQSKDWIWRRLFRKDKKAAVWAFTRL